MEDGPIIRLVEWGCCGKMDWASAAGRLALSGDVGCMEASIEEEAGIEEEADRVSVWI
jgi:hypothetical protein